MFGGKPFAGYEDFDACVAANSDKDDPKAYCASIMRSVEGKMNNASGAQKISSEEEHGAKAVRTLNPRTKAEIEGAMSRLAITLERGGMAKDEAKAAAIAFGAKCGLCEDDYVEWRPYGGAQTFDELREWRDASEQQWKISDLWYEFDMLASNIWNDEELEVDQKAAAITALANELESEVSAIQTGQRSAKEGGWLSGLRARFMGKGNQTTGNSAAKGDLTNLIVRAPAQSEKGVTEVVLRHWDAEGAEPSEAAIGTSAAGAMSVFRDKSGAYRYIAIASNRYFDKEGECFPAKAHREFCEWAMKTGELPELWVWHVPGSRVGKADVITYDEDSGFRVSLGTFDAGMEDVARKLMELGAKQDLAMSHGYFYDPAGLIRGVYEGGYRSFEESVLPSAEIAANIGTAFAAIREGGKSMLAPEQRKFFVDTLGEERTAALEGNLGNMQKELDAAGVKWKAILPGEKAEGEEQAPPAAEATADPPSDEAPAPDATAAAEDPKGGEEGDEAPPADAPSAEGDEQKALAGMKAAITEAVGAAMQPLAASMQEIASKVEAIEAELPALREAKEDQLAALIRPRQIVPGAYVAPSDDAKNVIRKGTAKEKDAQAAVDAAMQEEQGDKYASPLVGLIPMMNGFGGRVPASE